MTFSSTSTSKPTLQKEQHMDQTLLILGDTNIQNRPDPYSAFANVREMLSSADVVFGQLEGPLAEPSANPAQPDIPHKAGWRHSGAKVGPALKKAGYAGVSCASNVAYPASAAVASVKALDAVGILHCGVGETLAEARRPVIIEKNGVRYYEQMEREHFAPHFEGYPWALYLWPYAKPGYRPLLTGLSLRSVRQWVLTLMVGSGYMVFSRREHGCCFLSLG